MKKILLICSMLLLTLNCTNVTEDDLIDAEPFPDLVTYQANVKVIIDNNCISCHSMPPINNAPMPLVSYLQVKNAVENRDLIGSINGSGPGSLMPLGGPKLPQNLIDLIIKWEADGLIDE